MASSELKETILRYINDADDRLLHIVRALVESYQEHDVVSFTIDVKPLTKKHYNQELLDAKAKIEGGEFITQEDLERESQTGNSYLKQYGHTKVQLKHIHDYPNQNHLDFYFATTGSKARLWPQPHILPSYPEVEKIDILNS